jgi:Domain of unknown function (DUF3854)
MSVQPNPYTLQPEQPDYTTLSEEHRRMLVEESSISPDVIAARGYRTIRHRSGVPDVFADWQRRLGLLVPTHAPDGQRSGHQLKPNKPIPRKDGSTPKYETPAGSRITLDVNPLMLEAVQRGDGDLWITEGCKKVDSLASRGEPAVGFIGVWNMAVPKTKGTTPLPCWQHVRLRGRRVMIVFDADARTNPDVQEALRRTVVMLESLGAIVVVVYLPAVNGNLKAGIDDYFAAGGTVAELRLMAAPYQPVDVGAERLSRDEKLQSGVDYLWRDWHDRDWMHFVGDAERPNWQRGYTARDVKEAFIELAAQTGKVDARGIVVRVGLRRLAELSAKTAPSVGHAVKHLEADGQLEILPAEDRSKARKYRLLVPRAALYRMEKGHTEGTRLSDGRRRCKGLRAPTAPRLRWSSPAIKVRRLREVTPGTRRVRQTRRFHKDLTMKESRDHFPDTPYVKRLGPHRCAILDALEDAGGELHLKDLCEILHRKRPWDVRRRVLPMLEEAGIIECKGDVIRLAPGWLARLEEERERKGEISYAEKQRQEHRKQRERYHDYLESVRRQPSRAGQENVKRGRRLRDSHVLAQPPADQPSEASLSPLAEAVRDYLDRHPRQARQPAGWIGVTLWAEGLHPKLDNPPAETRSAVEELGGAAYLDAKLKEAKVAA